MENKFLREARDIAHLFCFEYQEDPDAARSNLEQRLKNKRDRITSMTYYFIEFKCPGALND